MPKDEKDKNPEPEKKGKGQNGDPDKNKGGGGDDPRLDKKIMASQYGFALAFMESDPELKKLFNQAVRETWVPDKFIAHLRNTKWFKSNSASVRNAILQQKADPATYKATVDQMLATVQDTWGQLFGELDVDEKTMRTWASTAVRMGWSQAQLMDNLTKGIEYRKLLTDKALGGTAAEMRGQIDTMLANYGIKMTDKWKASQLQRLVEGGDTAEGLQQRIKTQAMQEYKAFADRIQAGETVADIADPYIAKMADMLELNPNEVSLNDGLVQQALKQTTQDGKPAAMDLYSFEKKLRGDRRWQYTRNAHEEVSNLTSGLLKSFGLI